MRVHDRHIWRLLIGAIAVLFGVAMGSWAHLPQQDPLSYFNFADQRMFLGIPNFYDVISNLLFIYVGIWGMLNCLSSLWMRRPKALMVALFLMNASVFLTGWGSSYFHMMPNPTTLFWDRAPMAMAFMALLALILADRAPSQLWQVLVVPFMALGAISAWHGSYGLLDIRYYIVVQFGTLLMALALIFFRRPLFLNNKLMYMAFLFYVAAKVLEAFDHPVFERSFLSGHSLKHIMAAMAIFTVNMAVIIPVRRRL